MTTVYKLTTQDNKTRKGHSNERVWGPGVTHRGTGRGELCSEGYIHAYLSPELAVLLNPIHANIKRPKLWVCETEVVKSDNDLKVGGVVLTTLEEMPLPSVTDEQRVIFAILCAQKTYGGKSPEWDKWAADYIGGTNRTARAARAAQAVAYAARAAEAARAAYAAYAANVAAYAANAAAYAASAAAYAAAGATRAAGVAHAAGAACAAAGAAKAAGAAEAAEAVVGAAHVDFDLVELARQAFRLR